MTPRGAVAEERLAELVAVKRVLARVIAPHLARGDGMLVFAAMGDLFLDWLARLPAEVDPPRLLVAYTEALQRDYLGRHEDATPVQ